VRNLHLRSVCLASILLMLTVGVAVAQVTLTINPDCIECCPLQDLGPCPGYTAWVTSTGLGDFERPLLILTGPGPAGPFGTAGFLAADERGRLELQLIFLCENPWHVEEEATVQDVDYYWWIHPEWKSADHGRWTLHIRSQSGEVEGGFLFAEDCESAAFVPEPTTMLLFGGGLAGLAGYAALRLRSRHSA
jgi:hypothetical protein